MIDARGVHLDVGDRVVYAVKASTYAKLVEGTIVSLEGESSVKVRREKVYRPFGREVVKRQRIVPVGTKLMVKI